MKGNRYLCIYKLKNIINTIRVIKKCLESKSHGSDRIFRYGSLRLFGNFTRQGYLREYLCRALQFRRVPVPNSLKFTHRRTLPLSPYLYLIYTPVLNLFYTSMLTITTTTIRGVPSQLEYPSFAIKYRRLVVNNSRKCAIHKRCTRPESRRDASRCVALKRRRIGEKVTGKGIT